jgi:hypothetical protein
MSFFEKELQKSSLFPRIWIRYVDDIFVVVKSRFVQRTLNFLNNQHSSIKFTHEMEEDSQLPFLDVLVMRNEDKINLKIYRKPTSTNRFISSKSFHSFQHKNAAFNSMAHRLTHVPMDEENYTEKRNNISKLGSENGYGRQIIENILNKHERKAHRENLTTFRSNRADNEILRRISLPYFPKITNKLSKHFRKTQNSTCNKQ